MLLFKLLVLAVTAAAASESLFSRQSATLPSALSWTSSNVLIAPKNDSRAVAAIKDPSIIFYNNTIAQKTGYNLVYFNFSDFASANAAPFFYLDNSAIGRGYRAAPEAFYFAPQNLWYLIYQNGNAGYSTNPDISNPAGWTAPRNFYASTPALISQTKGNWVDMWVICDDEDCHLFSTGDNGRLYRSQTSVSQFPLGMSDPVIALQANRTNDLFEASNVYHLDDGTYLLLVECIGRGNSGGGVRYFRSWTSSSLAGTWTPYLATQDHPFAGAANVQFPGTTWTTSVSHGEMIRTDVDQHLNIGAPTTWQYLYQGIDPKATAPVYDALPWKLGLLTYL
ncbi:hypothetical protein ACEQ8H_000788 [Pleosporales sp. CAS-2024a]